jgi:adenylate cyclase
MPSNSFQFGSFTLDLNRACLRGPLGPTDLRRKSFEVLHFLVEHAGRVVSKEELIHAVWSNILVGDEALTKCISEVRRAIGDEDKCVIKTVPRRGYLMDVPVVAGEAIRATTVASDVLASYAADSALPLADRPSIAVLAFNNLSGDPQQEYFSDGITEDIIIELSRFSELMVIARNSTFQYKGGPVDVRRVGRQLGVRYVLEGSVQRDRDRIRISAQLVDALTGVHRWAERYDRKFDEVFTIQDEITKTIVTTLAAHLNKAEVERSLSKPPASSQGYDYFMRAADALASFWSSFDVEQLRRTRHLLEQSVTLDPKYARAYGLLSHTFVIAWTQPIDEDYLNPLALSRSHDLALKALQLAPNLPEAHAHLGSALTWKRQHDAALFEFSKAAELNPNLSDWRFATVLTYAGQLEKAIEIVRSHMRLDPFYPPWAPYWLGLAFYLLKQYPQAVTALRECTIRMPNFRSAHTGLAAAYAQLGLLEEVSSEVAETLRIDPDYAICRDERWRLPFRLSKDAEHLFDGLRKAGLPDA